MINREDEARAVAERYLDATVRNSVEEDVVTTSVREFPTCWVVGYNTRAHWETGAISHALAGGGPIIVNRGTGAARMGISALPAEEQVDPD